MKSCKSDLLKRFISKRVTGKVKIEEVIQGYIVRIKYLGIDFHYMIDSEDLELFGYNLMADTLIERYERILIRKFIK